MRSKSLISLNVVNPYCSKEMAKAWNMAIDLVAMGFSYELALPRLKETGVYVSSKTYELLTMLFDEALDLDIGDRQEETYR